MKQLEKNVIQWAKDRGIDHPSNAKNQLLKSFEEMGELSRGILKDDRELIIDSIGDVLVTLIILAQTQNLTLKECLDYAWNEIKDRKGKTVNGTFIDNQPAPMQNIACAPDNTTALTNAGFVKDANPGFPCG